MWQGHVETAQPIGRLRDFIHFLYLCGPDSNMNPKMYIDISQDEALQIHTY